MSLPPRWTPLRLLGAGGQGQVWLARDTELRSTVAVKVVPIPEDRDAVERHLREVRAARAVVSPNVVRVHELVQTGDTLAIVMEYLEGGSLAARARRGPIPPADAVGIFRDVLRGLEALHRAGIIHRDVKPSNILIGRDGRARVADLGTASVVDEDLRLTRTGSTVGTPAYMSPEQLAGGKVGPATDLYSLGVTMFEALAGRHPFKGRTGFEMARAHAEERPSRIRSLNPRCPAWFERFVDRLLAKRPGDRWPDATRALRAYERRYWSPHARKTTKVAAGTLAALALSVVCFWWVSGRNEASAGLRFKPADSSIVAVRDSGGEAWRLDLGAEIARLTRADLLGDAGEEAVAATRISEGVSATIGLVAIDARGREVARSRVSYDDSFSMEKWGFSERFGPGSVLEPVKLGEGGSTALLWSANHLAWYPSVLGVWQPRSEQAPRPVLVSSGHVSSARTADLDGDGLPEVVVTGVNNPLGYQGFVAVVAPFSGAPARSPDLLDPVALRTDWGDAVRAFLLLGEAVSPPRLESADPSGVVVSAGGSKLTLDPTSYLFEPRAADLRRFWVELALLGARLHVTGGSPVGELDDFRSRHSEILGHRGFSTALALSASRELALAGDLRESIGVLRAEAERGGDSRRLWRRLGEVYLLDGQRGLGRSALERACEASPKGHSPADALISLGLDAALHGDAALAKAIDRRVRSLGADRSSAWPRQLAVIERFFWGDFEECDVRLDWPEASIHAARVLQHWARLERGVATDSDLETIRRLQARAECRDVATIAEARWLYLDGHPERSARRAEPAVARLRESSRMHWQDVAWRSLGEWVLGRSLRGAGLRLAEAEEALGYVARRAPGTFYGRDAARSGGARPRLSLSSRGEEASHSASFGPG